MSNAFITFTVLSKDRVAIKHSRGSSLGAEKQFLKVRSRNYLPFLSNGGDTQTHRQTDRHYNCYNPPPTLRWRELMISIKFQHTNKVIFWYQKFDSIDSKVKSVHIEKDICFSWITFVKCIETYYMTYHLIALVEAILSILVWWRDI